MNRLGGSLKIIYACDYSLKKKSGKSRATKQKLGAIARNKNITLRVFATEDGWMAPFRLFINEFCILFSLFKFKPDVVITRGSAGVLAQVFRPFSSALLVREVHAAGLEELRLLPFKGVKRFFAYLKLSVSLSLDKRVDLRIFNHPQLLEWYENRYEMKGKSCFVYNGFEPSSASTLSQAEARKKFGLAEDVIILVFIGSASKWHGVEYIVSLQRCFNARGDNVQVVCGGGPMEMYDPEQLCLNFSPLDDNECADLIRAGDACLLPVADVRVSPGSPLKLYDYMVNKRIVIAQQDQLGYSDEVDRYNIGITVDFRAPENASALIIEGLSAHKKGDDDYPTCRVSWDDRIDEWLTHISKATR